jgi:hypothetical protein
MAILLEHERYTSIRIAIIASKNNSCANGFRSGRCTGAKQLDEWFNGLSFRVVVIEIEQFDSCEEGNVSRRCADFKWATYSFCIELQRRLSPFRSTKHRLPHKLLLAILLLPIEV